jgi:mannose-1-phosphate guanylyltransferase
MRHAVIMAGGSGTRLWPLSRRMRPKQLMRLFDGKSLLRIAVERLEGIFEPEHIWVITSGLYLDLVAKELPHLPRENLIGEPVGRDTANAIGLAAALIARRDGDATMAVFTADHIIRPRDKFAAAIGAGLDAAEKFPDALVTFGVTPTEPHTGYGYVRRGERVSPQAWRVREFKEKPDLGAARAYVASGEYYWNSGMFAWRVATIHAQLVAHLPENARRLDELAQRWEQLAGTRELAEQFGSLDRISIDFGVMERAPSVLVVEMPCEWLDLGSWTAVAKTWTPDERGNTAIASKALFADGENNIAVADSEHLIVMLGVSDLEVVHSDDATLICHRSMEQEIRNLANLRRQKIGDQYE